MVKPKYIKDHVTGYGKDLRRATDKKFGISNQLIVKAAMGDEKSLTQIADMGKVGERLQLALPAIKDHLKNYIQGNTNNLLEEYKTKLFASLEAENYRHDDAMDVIELQAWVDVQMKEIDAQAQLESISNKPFTAQLKADEDYEKRKIQHILEHGSEQDLKLLPRKQYVTNPLKKAWQNIREFFN
jgi:hypothetical protein